MKISSFVSALAIAFALASCSKEPLMETSLTNRMDIEVQQETRELTVTESFTTDSTPLESLTVVIVDSLSTPARVSLQAELFQ